MARQFAILLTVLMLCGDAFAGGVDFTGTWQLDTEASDSPDALLEATGHSWFERVAARNISVTQSIEQSGVEMHISLASPLLSRDETLRLDGTPVQTIDRYDRPVVSTSAWSADGDVLVTTSAAWLPDGTRLPVKISRSLTDSGRTMVQVVECTKTDGQTVAMKRVFRRVP